MGQANSFTLGVDYFVGAHLAELVNKETFNLYSILKRRNIGIRRAENEVVKLLIGKGLIFAASSSVTFVNKMDVSEYVDDAVAESNKRRRNREWKGKRARRGDVPDDEECGQLDLLVKVLAEIHGKAPAW